MRLGRGMAIVGMGCRFPGGADTPARFWDLLVRGGDAITEIPPDRQHLASLYDPDPATPGAVYSRWGGFVDGIDRFDAAFFGISPREARRIDPQQRLLLEVAWEALEDAGLPAHQLAGTATGVFVGISGHDYADLQSRPDQRALIDVHVNAGSATSIAANRISYLLDLRGPSVAVDTACSSALTALHLACASLVAGECEVAVVGAVNALLTPEPSIGFCKAGMLSPTGRCRPFDARADGYVRSEGAGAVVLKRLDRAVADGDPVWAVVRATGVNQDGRTPGISVPNPDAQQALMETVMADTGLTAAGVQYVEAHGTGTPVGDPREAQAIGAAMAGGPCLVGSAKGNVGHLEAAAGMVGLVKVALALRHRQVPPTVHFSQPHPDIPLAGLGLRVPAALESWPDTGGAPAVAAVNSFGFGGANAHAVLQEPPPTTDARPAPAGPHLLALSARSPAALRDLAGAWARHLDGPSAPLGDLCWTAAARRDHHEYRLAVAGATPADLRAPLAAYAAGDAAPAGLVAGRATGDPARTAFVFSGMGPLAWGVARELAGREPVVAAVLDECDRHLRPLAGWSLLDQLHGDREASFVTEPRAAHVANLAVQLALVALWRSWGVEPEAVAGHSSGEIAAACAAGAIDLAGAVHLAFHRGRLQQRKEGRGGMLAAAIEPGEVPGLVGGDGDRVTVAAVNGPASVTLSGDLDVLTRVAGELDRRGRFRRLLAVGVPYHSAALDDLRDEVLEAAGAVAARPPALPLVSTVSGDWLDGTPLDAAHWWANMRRPVQFAAAVDRLLAAGCDRFVEVGPHPVLAPAVRECAAAAGRPVTVVTSLRRGEPERVAMLRALGGLHVAGVTVDWAGVFGGVGTCVALPTYPWQRERHWFDAGPAPVPAAAGASAGNNDGHPLLGRRLATARPTWEADLGHPRLGFLDGHRVQGTVAFPAAGYVETVLAAARAMGGGGPVAVERLRLHRLLAGERAGVALQITNDGGDGDGAGLEVHSSPPGGEAGWTLRASARCAPPPAGRPPALDIATLQEQCRPADVDALYRSLAAAGLQYEGAFRSLTALWQGDGEALGRVEPPPAADGGGDGWCIHPAVLDAAFQAAAGLAGEPGGGGVVLPVSIGRVAWYGPAVGPVWSHAVVTSRAGAATEVDVTVVDENGGAVVRCERLRVQRVGGAGTAAPAGWRYEERWEPAPHRSTAPAADALAATVQPAAEATAVRLGLPDHYEAVAPALDALAVHHARIALEALGVDPAAGAKRPVDEVAGRAGIAPRHHRYLARLLAMVANAPPTPGPPPDPAAVAARYPAYRSTVELVRESGARLAATLGGDDDARQWMVALPWLDTLTELYGVCPGFRAYAEMAAEVVAAYQAGRGDGPLRVLEVGAGTGGATGPVLDRLPAGAAEYLATDVSPFFAKLLRRRFGDRPGVRTAVLDVERPPIEGGPFDVVVAADVVHATADVRRTLATLREAMAPGGLLVLVEAQSRAPWLDLLFGQFEGWWRHADGGLRPDHPLLDVPTWLDVLRAEGFTAAAVTDAGDPAGAGPLQAVLVGTLPPPAAPRRPPQHWLVLTDRRGVGPEVAAGLREAGHTCVLAWPGPAYRRFGADGVELAPAHPDGWVRLLAEAGPFDAVLHLWALDAPDQPGVDGPVPFQATTCGSVVALATAASDGPTPEMWLVTAGAQLAGGGGVDGPGLAQSPLWGLGRVARSEWGTGRCRLVDLGPGAPDVDVAALLDEVLTASDNGGAGGGDDELAFRGGRRLARRLDRPADTADAAATTPRERAVDRSPATASFRLVARRPGALDSLVLQETAAAEPGPGQVAVRVRAAALNFRDVLVALGLGFAAGGGDPSTVPLGWECAGVVESCGEGVTAHRPGDEVMVVAAGSLGARVVVPAGYAVALPAGLSPEEAATLPVAFLTAHCALVRQARLAPGERVLIHSASGGVGLAAVQVARQAGAEVLATAGTPEKRDYLRSLGIECVMDSRTLDFAAEVRAHTGGEGVDVVLNSLAGEAAARSLDLLRPYGRFVEIGKRDIYEDGRLDLAPFRRNLSYQALDLQPMYDHQPELLGELLAGLRAGVEEGRLQPLPRHQYDLAEAEQAFRFMAQARHIGKVVLTVAEPSYPVVPAPAPRFRPDHTYLVTGGLGGFGLAVARWMVAEGAGHLVLVSRSGRPRPEDQPAFDALLAAGANVEVRRGDVADAADVARVLAEVRAAMPALAGVVHAAMVLDDGLLGTLDWPRVEAVLRPKVAGAWNLHAATTAAGDDLDLFVLFSSISAAIGQPGQANYAAANAYLDALATHRHSIGRPALSVAWGVIAGAGYVARHPDIERRMARHGLVGMTVDDACAALGRLLDDGTTRAVVSRGRWGAGTTDDPERPPASHATAAAGPPPGGAGIRRRLATGPAAGRAEAVERYLAETAARVLEATGAVDPDRRLYELGFDSLMAVELTTTVRSDLGVELPIVDLLDGLTVRSLGQRVLERLDAGG